MQIHMHERRMRNVLSRVLVRKRMDSLFVIFVIYIYIYRVFATRDSYTPWKFIEFCEMISVSPS